MNYSGFFFLHFNSHDIQRPSPHDDFIVYAEESCFLLSAVTSTSFSTCYQQTTQVVEIVNFLLHFCASSVSISSKKDSFNVKCPTIWKHHQPFSFPFNSPPMIQMYTLFFLLHLWSLVFSAQVHRLAVSAFWTQRLWKDTSTENRMRTDVFPPVP